MKSLYDQDFLLWLEKTAYLLNHKQFEELDIKNLVEEIESMGRSEKQEVENRLSTIIEHLLKLIYWTEELEYNARGWRGTVIEQRRQLKRLLKKSPSLQSYLNEVFLECYQEAREDTLQKYELPQEMFPQVPAFTVEDILNSEYLAAKN